MDRPSHGAVSRLVAAVVVVLALAACAGMPGADEDWYYHWSCNGDPDCLATNPTGEPTGTRNEGPVQVNCTQLMEFARRFWGPSATNSCDHDPGGGSGPPPAPTLQSITVTPANLVLPLGGTRQLTATGHYSDGSSRDLTAQVTRLIPAGGAAAVSVLLEGLRQSQGSGVAAGIGIATLVFGATGVFGALQAALDDIWGVAIHPRSGLVRFLIRRLFSLAMVVAVAVLLLVSLFVNTLITLIVARFGGLLPGGASAWHLLNVGLALGTATGVFTLVFKFVPDAPVRWIPALVGGVVTAALFWIGEAVLAWYLGDAARLSVYGVFGSLIVLLLWVYYSAQILLFGAEVTKIYGLLSTDKDQPT